MESTINLSYFPKTEAIVFGIVSLACIAGVFLLGLSGWLVVGLVVMTYVVTLAGTTAVSISDDELKITSLNPFRGSHTVKIKSITKIKALDVLPDGDTRISFSLFTRTCEVQYLDEKQQKEIVHFSIFNKNDEKKIMKALKKLTKKEKIAAQQVAENEAIDEDDIDLDNLAD
ncbi:hypothetical protein BH09BAC3_BH09BAC3_18830 [soil metagenome]